MLRKIYFRLARRSPGAGQLPLIMSLEDRTPFHVSRLPFHDNPYSIIPQYIHIILPPLKYEIPGIFTCVTLL